MFDLIELRYNICPLSILIHIETYYSLIGCYFRKLTKLAVKSYNLGQKDRN